jgi:hypothetical protein
VVKFISDHKICDSVVFKNEMEDTDLENKLKIIEALIYEIIRKHSTNNEEFEQAKKEIQQPINVHLIENNEFALIEIKSPTRVLERINEPVKLALLSTSETVQKINKILIEIQDKMNQYHKSYLKNIMAISLQVELKNLNRQIKILDSRLYFLLELIKIPCITKN